MANRNVSPAQFVQGDLFEGNQSALGRDIGMHPGGELFDKRTNPRNRVTTRMAAQRDQALSSRNSVPDINNPQPGDPPRKNYSFIPGQRVMPEPEWGAQSHHDFDDYEEMYDNSGLIPSSKAHPASPLELNHEGNVYQFKRLVELGEDAEERNPHEDFSEWGSASRSSSGSMASGSYHPWSNQSSGRLNGSTGNPYRDLGPQFSRENQALWDAYAEPKEISTSAVLHTAQHTLNNPDHDHITGPMDPSSTTKIWMHAGVPWILDGHHRLMEARGRGLPTFHASVLDSDKIPSEELDRRGYM